MAVGLEVAASGVAAVLQTLAPTIAIILVILGGITYGIAQTQPGEVRGKWQAAAIGMVAGGMIVAAVSLAADYIVAQSGNFLKPV